MSFLLSSVALLAWDTAALGDWYIQKVDESPEMPYNAIAVDSMDRVHLVCTSNPHYDATLVQLTRSGSGWEKTPISTNASGRVRIAVDSHDGIHVCAVPSYKDDVVNKSLTYATNASGEWIAEELPVVPGHGEVDSVAMAVDSGASAYIVYSHGDEPTYRLWYATNSNGSWTTEEIAWIPPGATESYVRVHSMVCDEADVLHLVYSAWIWYSGDSAGASPTPYLKYATIVDGALTTVDFPLAYVNARSVSMAVDDNGITHFAFYNPVSGYNYTICYATFDGTSWTGESAADAGVCFWWPDTTSIAIDDDGNAHISYYSGDWVWKHDDMVYEGNRSLCYANNAQGDWSVVEIERVGSQRDPADTSIALDSAGRVHISYFKRYTADNLYHDDVKYATNSRNPELSSSAVFGALAAAGIVAFAAGSAYSAQHYLRSRR